MVFARVTNLRLTSHSLSAKDINRGRSKFLTFGVRSRLYFRIGSSDFLVRMPQQRWKGKDMLGYVFYVPYPLSGILWKTWCEWCRCNGTNENYVSQHVIFRTFIESDSAFPVDNEHMPLFSVCEGTNLLTEFSFHFISVPLFSAMTPLPGTTNEGYRVVMCKLLDTDASKYNYVDSNKLWVIFVLIR